MSAHGEPSLFHYSNSLLVQFQNKLQLPWCIAVIGRGDKTIAAIWSKIAKAACVSRLSKLRCIHQIECLRPEFKTGSISGAKSI